MSLIFSDLVDRAVEDARTAARVPLPHDRQMGIAQAIGDITRRYRESGKPKAYDPNDDPEIIARIKHTMKPNEKLMQWFARTMIGRASILSMTKAEITAAVARSEENAKHDWAKEPTRVVYADPPLKPTHPIVDTWQIEP